MTDSQNADKDPHKDTVFLPRTNFAMRANLPAREAAMWQRLRERAPQRAAAAAGRASFILHDGPPYANGHLHIGHALNKILKDMIGRSRYAAGFNTPYVAGWDCHGLPIEWKIEEEYRAAGLAKEAIDAAEFRQKCRAFAANWLEVQQQEFMTLGIAGIEDAPYNTMLPLSEAVIAQQLHNVAAAGRLYRRSKPVMWSCVEQTTLSDAEVEYHDKTSPAIDVAFALQGHDNTFVVIWTTTPWTIPANLAVAYNPQLPYGLYSVTENERRFVLADALAESFAKRANLTLIRVGDANLENARVQHPLHALGGLLSHWRPVLPADFVTADAGTGCVHIAPAHGEDDYGLWRNDDLRPLFDAAVQQDLPQNITADGKFAAHVPHFGALSVCIVAPDGKDGGANGAVIKALIEADALMAKGNLKHSYPHSWRSKAPLIFRNTSQWFIAMDDDTNTGVRAQALAALEKVQFYPEAGRTRLTSMVAGRPDWVISRQRLWGVPLALFVCKQSGAILNTPAMNDTIFNIFSQHGSDAWYTLPPTDFFADFNPNLHEQVTDILDVWFDSGATQAFVPRTHPHITMPADLYLEGSDQHRGWFQSSLLAALSANRAAPYKAVFTHGFVLDEKGEKMSKSKGNVVTPQEVCSAQGADILRLWVAMADVHDDLRLGKTVLTGTADTYRRLRNVLRWLLGSLHGADNNTLLPLDNVHALPPLEQYILHRLAQTDARVREAYAAFDFHKAFAALFAFCTNDLSSLYFDVRKDVVYCAAPQSPERRVCMAVLSRTLDTLLVHLAPILAFTAEEAWVERHGEDSSVHEQLVNPCPEAWSNTALAEQAERALKVRRLVNVCLEEARNAKKVGSSMDAAPVVHLPDAPDVAAFNAFVPDELCITAPMQVLHNATLAEPVVEFALAAGHKCSRCRRVLPQVANLPTAVCPRCEDAMAHIAEAAC